MPQPRPARLYSTSMRRRRAVGVHSNNVAATPWLRWLLLACLVGMLSVHATRSSDGRGVEGGRERATAVENVSASSSSSSSLSRQTSGAAPALLEQGTSAGTTDTHFLTATTAAAAAAAGARNMPAGIVDVHGAQAVEPPTPAKGSPDNRVHVRMPTVSTLQKTFVMGNQQRAGAVALPFLYRAMDNSQANPFVNMAPYNPNQDVYIDVPNQLPGRPGQGFGVFPVGARLPVETFGRKVPVKQPETSDLPPSASSMSDQIMDDFRFRHQTAAATTSSTSSSSSSSSSSATSPTTTASASSSQSPSTTTTDAAHSPITSSSSSSSFTETGATTTTGTNAQATEQLDRRRKRRKHRAHAKLSSEAGLLVRVAQRAAKARVNRMLTKHKMEAGLGLTAGQKTMNIWRFHPNDQESPQSYNFIRHAPKGTVEWTQSVIHRSPGVYPHLPGEFNVDLTYDPINPYDQRGNNPYALHGSGIQVPGSSQDNLQFMDVPLEKTQMFTQHPSIVVMPCLLCKPIGPSMHTPPHDIWPHSYPGGRPTFPAGQEGSTAVLELAATTTTAATAAAHDAQSKQGVVATQQHQSTESATASSTATTATAAATTSKAHAEKATEGYVMISPSVAQAMDYEPPSSAELRRRRQQQQHEQALHATSTSSSPSSSSPSPSSSSTPPSPAVSAAVSMKGAPSFRRVLHDVVTKIHQNEKQRAAQQQQRAREQQVEQQEQQQQSSKILAAPVSQSAGANHRMQQTGVSSQASATATATVGAKGAAGVRPGQEAEADIGGDLDMMTAATSLSAEEPREDVNNRKLPKREGPYQELIGDKPGSVSYFLPTGPFPEPTVNEINPDLKYNPYDPDTVHPRRQIPPGTHVEWGESVNALHPPGQGVRWNAGPVVAEPPNWPTDHGVVVQAGHPEKDPSSTMPARLMQKEADASPKRLMMMGPLARTNNRAANYMYAMSH